MQQHIVQTCYTHTHTHSAIPTAGLGVLAGAVILYFLKSKGRRAAAVNWIALVLCILPAIAAFLPSCPAIPIAGINTPYLNKLVCVCVCVCVCVHIKPPSTAHSPLMMSSSHPATLTANCTSTIFEPVCGADGITYFSPCRGGCQKRILDGAPNVSEWTSHDVPCDQALFHISTACGV